MKETFKWLALPITLPITILYLFIKPINLAEDIEWEGGIKDID